MSGDVLVFNLARRLKRRWSKEGMAGLDQSEVDEINAVLRDAKRAWGIAPEEPVGPRSAPAEASGTLRPSAKGLALIKEFEGYHRDLGDGRVAAYPDPATGGAPWTIGWGSTGPDIRRGTIWTREQAEQRFAEHVNSFSRAVAQAIGDAPTAQHEFDAMLSLAYNVGVTNFSKSTLLRKHKAGDKAGAAGEFGKWNKAGGRVMAGLTRRRDAEARMYRGQA
jgi:lysozyme